MRLQLIATLGLAVAVTSTAHAQSTFESTLQVYADDDHTQVVSPVVAVEVDLDDHHHLGAGYVADVVSSASIDIVTQASATTIHDTRHQANVNGWRQRGDWKLSGGYTFSIENDYRSHGLAAGVARELFGKNSTLAVRYALLMNDVGRADDRNFSRPLTVHDVGATWTQVVNRRTVAQATGSLAIADGFQASPYRFVPVRNDEDDPMFWVPETDPALRVRGSVVVSANRHVGDDSSLQGDYRLYRDSWGITSHTLGARTFVNLTPRLELRLRARLYAQNGATFYQARYRDVRPYMTIDRELSPMWSATLGAKLMIAASDRLEAALKVDGFYYRYAEFPSLSSRLGTNAGAGLTLTY